jgi:uncharacterized protein (TIGR02145 family)
MNEYDGNMNPTQPKTHYGPGSADINQVINTNPDNAESYNARGFAYAAKGDYDRAIADFDQAIKLNPNYAEAYNSRGLAYAGKKGYDRAIADFDQAIRINPNYTDAFFNRGVVYIGKKEYSRAIVDLGTVLQLNPRHKNARKFGKMARQQQMKQEAPTASEKPRKVIAEPQTYNSGTEVPIEKEDRRSAAELKAVDTVIEVADNSKTQSVPQPKPETAPISENIHVQDAIELKAVDTVIEVVDDSETQFILQPKPETAPISENRHVQDTVKLKTDDTVIKVADDSGSRCNLLDSRDVNPIVENTPPPQMKQDVEKTIERKEQEPQATIPTKKETKAASSYKKIVWGSVGLGILLLLGVVAAVVIRSNNNADDKIYVFKKDSGNTQKSKQDPTRATEHELYYIPIMSDNGFYKYITLDGKDITEAKYIRAYVFQEGRALVQHQDSLWGYIDTAGKSFVGSYKQALSFKDGMAWVNDKGTVKALDLSGRITYTLPNNIISIWSFYDGLALFSMNGGQGYMDRKFETIGDGHLFTDGNRFQESAASVMCDNGKYGYIDNKGKFIIDCNFDVAKTFVNSKAIVKTDNGWGLINKRGNYVFGPFRDIEIINLDANMFKFKKDGKWGWLDSNGKVILQPIYEDIMSFDDRDIAPVKQDGKWGYINKSGTYVINGQYDGAYPFFNNRALVKIDDNLIIIDKKGTQVLQLVSQKIDPSYWNYINSGVVGGPRIMSVEPSFKCDASGLSEAEKMICRSVQLAIADKAVDSLYRIALNNNQNAAISQREFVAERNKCRTVNCIESVYATRNNELNNQAPASSSLQTTMQITSVNDIRDGKVYNVVRIGSQTWMVENLSYNASGSVCYNSETSNCGRYGRLYDWNTAKNACPSGWRLPSRREWNDLVATAGASSVAGKKLKATSPSWNGTNDYGFSALPGGYRNDDGSFSAIGTDGSWWTATESNSSNAYLRYIGSDYENVLEMEYGKSNGFSVRCVMNAR